MIGDVVVAVVVVVDCMIVDIVAFAQLVCVVIGVAMAGVVVVMLYMCVVVSVVFVVVLIYNVVVLCRDVSVCGDVVVVVVGNIDVHVVVVARVGTWLVGVLIMFEYISMVRVHGVPL